MLSPLAIASSKAKLEVRPSPPGPRPAAPTARGPVGPRPRRPSAPASSFPGPLLPSRPYNHPYVATAIATTTRHPHP